MNTMLKNLNLAVLVVMATCAVSNITAYNHVLKPSETVKNGGGKIHYGMAAVAGGLDFQDIDINTNNQIGWNSAGMCIHGYDITIVGGKYDGESFKFERNFHCLDSNLFLGTPEELQAKINAAISQEQAKNPNLNIEEARKFWNQYIHNGTQGKLQLVEYAHLLP